ncbi:hypothetical protein CP965_10755 [Halarcobacter mediterraneus]|uniref:Uncharacterized protein n=1 Tax=Halarcobacter mediterraneus TaxID=2023153 RepID=A0A4Q1AW73_9BACT|nr:transporter substrate-binding domain-containing protein [Halarcobacter mediterraneus]RXK12242.1 hypothetical protein CP965_10755 [Halarcobacter mediterraneus]
MRILIFILLTFCIGNTLEIVFEQRKPYVEKTEDSIKGLVGKPIINALNKAQIEYILKEKPFKRQLYEIKSNTKEICALGWFKTKEREKFSKYSTVVYQDKPLGIIALSNKNFLNHIHIDKLFSLSNLKVLVKASYSYGTILDEKLKNPKLKKNEVFSSHEKMLNLIKNKRADYMFISKEEADVLLKNEKKLSYYSLEGLPTGNKRYLMCSKLVEDTTIKKINKFLKDKK